MFQKTVKTKLKDLLDVAKISWEDLNLPESLKEIKKKKKRKKKKKKEKGEITLDKWTKDKGKKGTKEKIYPA